MSVPSLKPETVFLKMGMFPRIPVPEAESFAIHRQAWQGLHTGVIQYATVRGGQILAKEIREIDRTV